MSLKSVIADLNEAVKDLTSLHVQTFTGSIDFTVDTTGKKDIEKALDEAKEKGTVKLVSETLMKFDGDSYNFISNDKDTVIPPQALEIHKNAVDSGIKNRQALVELFKEVIK